MPVTTIAYAALLRGVNLGGHKKLPMADLRMLLAELGLGDVRTYLQAVADACPFPAASLDGRQLHATFLSEPVAESRLSPADAERFLPEEVRYGDRVRYLYTPAGLGRSRLAEALARSGPPEGVVATTRNWNTVIRLVELTAGG